MWSGPRTISTALMRSWENRPDTVVVDEPLYGFYLASTGSQHPGRDEIIQSMPNGWRQVLSELTLAPLPAGKNIYYQKHMTHHLLPEVDRDALAGLSHAFLIRDPRQLLASYAKVRGEPTLADLGLAQQVEIFRAFGGPVVDAGDILRRPEPMLRALCGALGVPFEAAMLSWPAGPGTPMGCGRSTGMTACGGRPGSARTGSRLRSCRRTWSRSPPHAAPFMTNCPPTASSPAPAFHDRGLLLGSGPQQITMIMEKPAVRAPGARRRGVAREAPRARVCVGCGARVACCGRVGRGARPCCSGSTSVTGT